MSLGPTTRRGRYGLLTTRINAGGMWSKRENQQVFSTPVGGYRVVGVFGFLVEPMVNGCITCTMTRWVFGGAAMGWWWESSGCGGDGGAIAGHEYSGGCQGERPTPTEIGKYALSKSLGVPRPIGLIPLMDGD